MKNSPKICGTCRFKALQTEVLDYQATFDHDGRPYEFTVPHLQVLKCANCGAIVLDDVANDKISDQFRHHAGLLTPVEIRSSRESLKLQQKQLAAFLDVSISTLSRWETGAQIQQRAMDKLLRLFFEVPEVREYLGYRTFLTTSSSV